MTTTETQLDGKPLLDMYAQMRRRGALLIWLAFGILLVSVVMSALLNPPPVPDVNKLGVHLLLDDGRNHWDTDQWAEHVAYAGAIAGENAIAVQVLRSDDLDAAKWQHFIDLCAEHQLTPVLRLATTYDLEAQVWTLPTPDADGSYGTLAQAYADFLAALTWHDLTPHVILLNEVNNGAEWGGIQPDPAAYARFVQDVAPVLRAAIPELKILNAAIDTHLPHTGSQPFPDGFYSVDAATYLDALYAADPQFFTQFDYWNSHVYPLGAFRKPPSEHEYRFDAMHDAPPVTALPPRGIYNRGINSYAWELWKLQQFGVTDLQVMITETGYRYAAAAPDSADAADDYPDEQRAAKYLNAALMGDATLAGNWQPLLSDKRVVGVAVFALDGVPWEWAHTNLLNMHTDGSIAGTTLLYDVLAAYFDHPSAANNE